MRTYLQSFGCTTGAGRGATALIAALRAGRSHVRNGTCRIERQGTPTHAELAQQWLQESVAEAGRTPGPRTGIILASTKGSIEDYLGTEDDWGCKPESLSSVLETFLQRSGFSAVRTAVVSNACASSHGALFFAQHWLRQGFCDSVLVLAVDILGQFIEKGFRSLQAVSVSVPRPFSRERDGLALGEGAAALWLSTEPSPWELAHVSLVTEGVALTRPSAEGVGLEQACREADFEKAELIIAHATGTQANDAAEARVFRKISPWAKVTGTKWCIGHTLAVSGALDLIAAADCLRTRSAFPLGTTTAADPALGNNFVTPGTALEIPQLRRVGISSLGFGGMNAAVLLTDGGDE